MPRKKKIKLKPKRKRHKEILSSKAWIFFASIIFLMLGIRYFSMEDLVGGTIHIIFSIFFFLIYVGKRIKH